MKRLLCLLLTLLLCTGCAGAEQAFSLLSAPLEGSVSLPAESPVYRLNYALPQVVRQDDVGTGINIAYAAVEESLKQQPLLPTEEWDAQTEANLSFETSFADERYICFVFTLLAEAGNGETATLWADTFALDGLYAGQKVSLSQLLGLEEQEGASLSAELAYELVWQIVSQESLNPDSDYLDGLTEEQVRSAFAPEEDFYLDRDGNVVFFIPSGEIAGEIAGMLEFPFSIAEILSAVR